MLSVAILFSFSPDHIKAKDRYSAAPGNFGLPGIIDLPSARRFRDGELVFTHQNHKYLFMSGISFQALPRLGLSFRYGGLGLGGGFAQNRLTWDRSFSAHISLLDEESTYQLSHLVLEISLERDGILLSILLEQNRLGGSR